MSCRGCYDGARCIERGCKTCCFCGRTLSGPPVIKDLSDEELASIPVEIPPDALTRMAAEIRRRRGGSP